jgi:hypothetical protein
MREVDGDGVSISQFWETAQQSRDFLRRGICGAGQRHHRAVKDKSQATAFGVTASVLRQISRSGQFQLIRKYLRVGVRGSFGKYLLKHRQMGCARGRSGGGAEDLSTFRA